MKYSLPKKIIYSIIVAVLLVGLVLTAFFDLMERDTEALTI